LTAADSPSSKEETLTDIQEAVGVFDELLKGTIAVKTLTGHETLYNIREKIHMFEESHKDHKTALLWIQYLRLVDMLQKFITAERTGNWFLHLQTLKEMLAYFAATGHNNYTKSSHVYLSKCFYSRRSILLSIKPSSTDIMLFVEATVFGEVFQQIL
jgi:hypothetical protein